MIRYIAKRILLFIPVIVLVAFLIFSLLYITPGDPVTTMMSSASSEQIAAVKAQLGLDRSYFQQLGDFMKQLFLHFDLGSSYVNRTSVRDAILQRLPYTARIAAVSCLLQLIIGVPLGVAAATHQNGLVDRFCIVLAMLGHSLPGFLYAIFLALIFGVHLGWLPTFGISHWYNYILPCCAAALMGLSGIARQTRSQMLDIIRSDYCVTARAKGVPERSILYVHALPNALIPVITSLGSYFGKALGGTVVIENVFAIPGIGLYLVEQGIGARDYPIVRGVVVVLALLFSIVMLVVDIIYAFVDPRIKASYEKQHVKRVKKHDR